MASSGSVCPGPGRVLDGVVVTEEAVVALQRRDRPGSSAGTRSGPASWSCRRTWRWSTRRARSRSSRGRRRRRARRGARGGRPTARAARTAERNSAGSNSFSNSRSSRSMPTTPSSSCRSSRLAAQRARARSAARGRACPRGRGTRRTACRRPRPGPAAVSSTTPAASIGMMPTIDRTLTGTTAAVGMRRAGRRTARRSRPTAPGVSIASRMAAKCSRNFSTRSSAGRCRGAAAGSSRSTPMASA